MTAKTGYCASCSCGQVTLKAIGGPILSAVCYCESCRAAARQFEQEPGAPSVLRGDGGVEYCLFRKDRVTISRGGECLRERRLIAASPTRRVIATCCNSPMFLDFTSGHWLNLYRDRLSDDAPPLEMGVMVKDQPTGAELPDGIPSYPARPAKFMIKLLAAWVAMGFRRAQRLVESVTADRVVDDIGAFATGQRAHPTPGYFQAPELDAEAFDRDGYFLTGDLGSIDVDGRVRFRGRLKEMIKTGGVNVAPLEVEQVLLRHPDIVQAYVVGVPDQSKGEIVAAVVELRAGAVRDTASIVGFCRERLASYKVPVRLAIRSAAEFPRTPTGKIHKPRLRQELAAAPRHDEGAAIAASLVPDRSG